MNQSAAEFGLSSEEIRIADILQPYAMREMRKVRVQKAQFAYYTSASTAVSILQNQEIWLRNITEMNDYGEIEYGVECLSHALKTNNNYFKKLFDFRFPGFSERFITAFNARLPQLKKATYICCVSQHSPKEDLLGRLSMWRAYGGKAGVALIFKSDPFLNSQQNFGAYSSPIAYFTFDEMADHLFEVLQRIEASRLNLLEDEEDISKAILHIFEMAAIATKHPGFKEEQEWRIFYRPTLDSNHLAKYCIKSVGSIPQGIYKLKLENRPDEKVTGFTIKENLERIIIGPTDHAFVIREALVSSLQDLGIENALELVVESNIPLRVPF